MSRILLIDDKKDNLITLSALLKTLIPGCSLITAQSGAEGLKKAEAELPDTILLDIKMPVMNGYDVCKKLKQGESTRHIPVIMLSAIKTESDDLVKGLETGADAFLTKPIDESVLVAQISTALRIKKAEDLLRNQKDLLAEMVGERTAELANSNVQLKREIDERKQAVEALTKSEDRFRTIFEQSPFGIALIDSLTGDIYEVNPRFAEIAGRTLEEMIKIDWMSITHPDDVQEDLDNMTLLNAGGITGFNMDKRYIHPDGSHIWINMTIAPVKAKDKTHPRHLCMIEDITASRKTAEEKERLEAQLQQSQKMEAIGTLAGGIAHDFNNILGGIMGYAELAKMKLPEESKIIGDLEQVIKSSKRAADLVKQILTVSRRHKKEQRPVQVRYIVNEALKLLKATLPTTIEIQEDLARDTGIVNADPTQMHQVIMNLCTNAGHAMEKNGGVLEITLANVELDDLSASKHLDLAAGSYLRLTVSDTGHGMTPEIMERIFDPYFTTKDTGEGTGLGLSVAQGIVKAHGGTITVYSELGNGTTFHVYLPIIQEVEKAEKAESEEPLPTGNERILFIDDEQVLVEMASQMLERLGYGVVVKTNSTEALELFRAEPDKFDLVITDMTMPHITGDKLAQELLKIRPDIPIILCTGHSKRISEEKAKELGIRVFVMKPISTRVMAETVRKALD